MFYLPQSNLFLFLFPFTFFRIFIGFQWVLLSLQFISTVIIDDVPPEVTIQLERNEFINLKVIEKVADEDYGVVHAVEDEEEQVEEGRGKRGPVHCGNLCGIRCKPPRPHLRAVRSRRIRDDLSDFGIFDYPTEPAASGSWPKALHKARTGEAAPMSIRDQKAAKKKAAMEGSSYDTSSYVSTMSAVAAPSKAGVVDPNSPAAVGAAAAVAGVPRAASPTVGGGYSAVPPPAPGYV